MKKLVQEKARAILLRKKGYSYKEILAEISVAKSSLSLWLKDLPLTKNERRVLKKRKHANISRGRIRAAGVLAANRKNREHICFLEAQKTLQEKVHDPFFHVGIILYWAEGAKRTNQWSFINSDEQMIDTMLLWLELFGCYNRNALRYRLYIHKCYASEDCETWWQQRMLIKKTCFGKTIYKPGGKGVKKRPDYRGCLRIEVPKSKELLIKMKFWQSLLVDYYRKG